MRPSLEPPEPTLDTFYLRQWIVGLGAASAARMVGRIGRVNKMTATGMASSAEAERGCSQVMTCDGAGAPQMPANFSPTPLITEEVMLAQLPTEGIARCRQLCYHMK